MKANVDPNPRMIVVFRNDDISARSDVAHERRVAAIFERYGVPQTIGVIPRCTAGSFRNPNNCTELSLEENEPIVAFLRDHVGRSGSEIALHGYSHRTNQFSRPERREFFEFRRLSLAEQTHRIERGTEIIYKSLGICPVTFIPPWNRLDFNTLYACRQNQYHIVSSGPFTPTLDGLGALGTDCSIDTFTAAFASARDAQERVFFRILYHSSTIRTDADFAALERVVALAANSPGCEVLTLSETFHRYAEEANRANEAARNVVPQDEIPGSPRARAVVYRRALDVAGLRTKVDQVYATAAELYSKGQYAEACTLSSSIDSACKRLLVFGRSVASGLGVIVAVLLVLIGKHVFGWDHVGTVTVMLVLFTGVGIYLHWRATAPDTKREIRAALQAALLGAVVGINLF